MSTPYSQRYYEALKEDSLASAREVVPRILKLFPSESVVDVGCGAGTWTRVYAEAGCRITGIDGSTIREDQLLFPKESFIRHDLNQRLESRTTYDLVHCVEVAEHLSPERATTFVADLCAMGKVIVFSAAIPGQGGTFHVNEQWQDYWVGLFEANGYLAFDCFRSHIWDNPNVAWWYCQNLFAFIHPSHTAAVESARKATSPLPRNLVHPRAWLAATVPQSMSPRMLPLVVRALPHFPAKIITHLRK